MQRPGGKEVATSNNRALMVGFFRPSHSGQRQTCDTCEKEPYRVLETRSNTAVGEKNPS